MYIIQNTDWEVVINVSAYLHMTTAKTHMTIARINECAAFLTAMLFALMIIGFT